VDEGVGEGVDEGVDEGVGEGVEVSLEILHIIADYDFPRATTIVQRALYVLDKVECTLSQSARSQRKLYD